MTCLIAPLPGPPSARHARGRAEAGPYDLFQQLFHTPPQRPLLSTPGELGLLYQDVTFPSREDRLPLRGWLIPGILPSGALTLSRTGARMTCSAISCLRLLLLQSLTHSGSYLMGETLHLLT